MAPTLRAASTGAERGEEAMVGGDAIHTRAGA